MTALVFTSAPVALLIRRRSRSSALLSSLGSRTSTFSLCFTEPNIRESYLSDKCLDVAVRWGLASCFSPSKTTSNRRRKRAVGDS